MKKSGFISVHKENAVAPDKNKNSSDFKVIIRGVRGSYPICGKEFLKYGGNTTCYEIIAGECRIIIDAGTGIIGLGNELVAEYYKSGKTAEARKPIEGIILFSHLHVDHIQGLPFFTPLFLASSTFYLYGQDLSNISFEEAMQLVMVPPFYPMTLVDMVSLKLFRSISPVETIYWNDEKGVPTIINNAREFERKKIIEKDYPVRITCMKSYAHPYEGSLIFRIEYNKKSVVVATDTEGYVFGDTQLIKFSEGADLLLHDACYPRDVYVSTGLCKQGYGHSTLEMAVDVAKRADVKRLGLIHHDPANTDIVVAGLEKEAKKHFKNTFAAYEEQEIVIA
jgi:phosphoribosyl 1,2-cyclic phosphodiesterase